MTKILSLLTTLFALISGSNLNAQVFPDRHTTNAYDGWVSCTKSNNPNTVRGSSHWIRYHFNTASPLYDMIIWNLNHPEYIKDGLNKVIIDVSNNNGSSWTMIDTFTFPKAPGSGFYEGFRGPDMGGVMATDLLITGISNHGGGCYGLSEVRIYTTDQNNPDLEFAFTTCENDGVQLNLSGGVAYGGSYSGIGVTNNGDETFNFDVDKVGPGIHEIKYTYGATVLTGHITVLACQDPTCQECEQCKTAEQITINGPIATDIYSGYQLFSGGQVNNNADVRFRINNSAQLNSGFQVGSSSNFVIDFRTCYTNVLLNSDFENGTSPWTLGLHNGATATYTLDTNNPYEGTNSAKVQVNSTSGTDWHVQFQQGNQTIQSGAHYRVSFAARANSGGPMSVIFQENSSPWQVYASKDFIVSENWETYAFEFTAEATVNNNIGIRALLGSTPNKTFWIDNFRFMKLD
ncbi:MAG: carbohydrate binding domain-containing protein [Saprospiraceae bacterium]|nr:carbohydrate binding domain-containing protein [Saprospiraceae bacterium]